MEDKPSILRRSEDSIARVGKLIGAGGAIVALATALWAQILGPGVQSGLQDFLGIRAIEVRLSELEARVPPPRVVEWNVLRFRQIRPCYPGDVCTVILHGRRTKYGETCGAPISTQARFDLDDGREFLIPHAPTWRPVELTTRSTSFDVQLSIPGHIPAGEHLFTTTVVYPRCPAEEGAATRTTPGFGVIISERPSR